MLIRWGKARRRLAETRIWGRETTEDVGMTSGDVGVTGVSWLM
jgi:hypothetical protein